MIEHEPGEFKNTARGVLHILWYVLQDFRGLQLLR